MSERFWQRLSLTLGWLSIGVLFSLITFSSSIEIKDLDLWLHLRMGEWISRHGFVPSYDVLSCTIAGKPWVNHEWLFQVLVFKVYKAFGFDGLISMQSAVVAVTFLVLLFLGYNRNRQWLVVFALLMVLIVYQSRFTIRPDIFSLLYFVLDIYILALHINKRWAVYALFILQILWTNMHGYFFFGPLLIGLGVLSEFIKRRLPLPYEWNTVGRLTDDEYKSLQKIFPILILACCINPLTFKGAWYPVGVFFHLAGENKIFFEHILELQRPITAVNIWTDRYMHYKILIILSTVSFVFNRRKIDISSLLVWLIFLGFSLAAVRNLIYFATAAYLVLMVNAISLSWEGLVPFRFSSSRFKYITGIACKAALIWWIFNFGLEMTFNGYFDFDTYSRKSEFFGVSKRVYPYKAVDFLLHQGIKGNFFNDFNSGAYLIGRTYPNIKVFIDGRTEVYGAAFFETYQKIWQEGNAKVFAQFERKYDITGAFLNDAHQEIPPAVLKMFHSFKNWSIVYLDDDAVIFLKQTPANKPFIDRLAVNLKKWEPAGMDLFKLGTKRIDPFPLTSRARILETLGAPDAAIKECREALAVAPDYAAAYKILGRIYQSRKDYRHAFEYFRLGGVYAPGDVAMRSGLALAYENLKNYQGAIGQYQRWVESAPKDPHALLGLARVYALAGQDRKALDILQQAQKLAPEDKVDVQKIRDIIKNKKIKPNPAVGQFEQKKKAN
ncbi:MAG: tetratricopeptide repeat protein [Candidatus Omnitrophica bacterium]|nr:tetratricopeptide repeat protein [Candidatus Omnitrophota bacterium]